MFLKKSLLSMTALALLIFAGQASAQSISIMGTPSKVSGQGTEITVVVSQTGVTQSVNAIQIEFDIDTSVITLMKDDNNMQGSWIISPSGDAASLLSIAAIPVPASASFTFTTNVDVTGQEFSVGIKKITLDKVEITPSAVASFNGLEAALTSDGAVNDAGELAVNVAVPDLAQATTGAEIMFVVDPADAATITGGMPATGLGVPPGGVSGMSVTLLAVPAVMLDGGSYGSVTFTVNPDATEFTIRIASLTVFTADGMKRGVGGGEALTVVQFAPYLEASATAVTVPYGETATAMVTAMDTQGKMVEFTVDPADAGTVSDDGNSVTLSATGNATVSVSAMVGGVALGPVEVVFTKAPPELQTESTTVMFEDFGASASAMVTAVGFDAGAEINLKLQVVPGLLQVLVLRPGR